MCSRRSSLLRRLLGGVWVALTFATALCVCGATAAAQWQMQQSNTTASLRGIAAVPAKAGPPMIAWASGTNGTVLRTIDGGDRWTACTIPPDAAKLDFRGVQAFDEMTAIVMSSGPGDQSRLYKTTDGCKSWKLLFTNPHKDGFWDAINAADQENMILLGDPVDGQFVIEATDDGGRTWTREHTAANLDREGAFAASNSSLLVDWSNSPAIFGSGGVLGARLFLRRDAAPNTAPFWMAEAMPAFAKGDGAGIFSLGHRDWLHLAAVGGDYTKPDATIGTAALTSDGGKTWQAASATPNGYRSAVAWDEAAKTWITVGPNGTDISTDDGRNWRALKPSAGDAAGADRDWNALSLPFVVGPKGRIGKLEPSALAAAPR